MPKCNIEKKESRVVKMSEMKPLQVGRVIDEGFTMGHIVWRTASTGKFEVVDLSRYGQDSCWTKDNPGLKFRLFPPDEWITVILSND